jgi:TolA-binding protein
MDDPTPRPTPPAIDVDPRALRLLEATRAAHDASPPPERAGRDAWARLEATRLAEASPRSTLSFPLLVGGCVAAAAIAIVLATSTTRPTHPAPNDGATPIAAREPPTQGAPSPREARDDAHAAAPNTDRAARPALVPEGPALALDPVRAPADVTAPAPRDTPAAPSTATPLARVADARALPAPRPDTADARTSTDPRRTTEARTTDARVSAPPARPASPGLEAEAYEAARRLPDGDARVSAFDAVAARRGALEEQARFQAARASIALGRLGDARARLEALRARFPRGVLFAEASLAEIEVELRLGAYDAAEATIADALQARALAARASELHFLRGEARRLAGRCAEAAPAYRLALGGPAHARALAALDACEARDPR